MIEFAYVEQKHRYGCAIACVAMVTGQSYDEVERLFETDFDRKGMGGEAVRNYVCDHNFAVIEKRAWGYANVRAMNERMKAPFADIHIVGVQPFADSKLNHSFVMDAKGEIFDPARPDNKEWDYYFVHHVYGFFKEG